MVSSTAKVILFKSQKDPAMSDRQSNHDYFQYWSPTPIECNLPDLPKPMSDHNVDLVQDQVGLIHIGIAKATKNNFIDSVQFTFIGIVTTHPLPYIPYFISTSPGGVLLLGPVLPSHKDRLATWA